MNLNYNAFMLRYHEIAIKGKNRRMFENKLVESVKRLLSNLENLKVINERGRIIVHLSDWAIFSEAQSSYCIEQLKKCFGVETFSPCLWFKPELAEIEKNVVEIFDSAYEFKVKEIDSNPLRLNTAISYRMRARRSDKRFPMTTKEMEIHFANILIEKYPRLTVDLMNAEFTIGLEVREKSAFVWFDSISGPGGLPIGSSSPVMALLSGGIDSPAACYSIMKRGARCSFITFHSHPYTPPTSLTKVAQIAKVINSFQGNLPLFACNLASAQKAVRDNCNERFRTILYRRMMMKVASVVSDWRNEIALVTGESLGQVASQTLENMTVINSSTSKLIIRPLVGMDKMESIRLAEKLGTFELSKIDVPDSCTIFAPASPATSSKLHFILAEERKLPMADLVRECVKAVKLLDQETYEQHPCQRLYNYVDGLSDEELYI
ncbi:MAG: tRNA uracil 4-sulfurtransferase ThiI [Lentisphaeria bacterium]